jgi:methylmalonyl-CoA mutase cobalamin-binding subunit
MQEPQTNPADTEQLAPLYRLRPIRTLVVSDDLDYKDRALTVLSELGPTAFATGSLSDPDDVVKLVAAKRADVVVLDATGCHEDAATIICKLADALPRVGVVVVCQHCSDAARELDALPKWGWTQDLRAGVERAYGEGNPLRPRLLASVRRAGASQRRRLRPSTKG